MIMIINNKTMVLFEKKLGNYLLLELKQDNATGELVLTLYKKWSKYFGYEPTGNTFTFAKEQREKALIIYDSINLKNVYQTFKKL